MNQRQVDRAKFKELMDTGSPAIKRAYQNAYRAAKNSGKGPATCTEIGREAALKAQKFIQRQRTSN